jgi:hypothetical protein
MKPIAHFGKIGAGPLSRDSAEKISGGVPVIR